MIVHELPNGILYIENVFDQAQEFIDKIEEHENDLDTHSVIPAWEDWYDSIPKKISETEWEMVRDPFTKGKQKLFNWDVSSTNKNRFWPRPKLVLDEIHKKLEPTVDMINKPYLKILDVWYEKTGNSKLDYISKNYFLRKYHAGGMIGPHIDKNADNPLNTMDWSVLFYLNDDYEGGELFFPDLDITIKPSAGSAIFFPCTTVHVAEPVKDGEKYYIFMVIHTEFGYSSGLGEPYHEMNELILEHKGIKDHPLLDLKNNIDNVKRT
jgi:hypothetical protein